MRLYVCRKLSVYRNLFFFFFLDEIRLKKKLHNKLNFFSRINRIKSLKESDFTFTYILFRKKLIVFDQNVEIFFLTIYE